MKQLNQDQSPHRFTAELLCRIDPQGRLRYVNPHSFLALGRKPAALLGRPLPSVIPPGAVRDAWTEALQTVLAQTRTLEVELPCRFPAGDPHHLCAFLPETNAGGELKAVTVIAINSPEPQVIAANEDQRRAKGALMSNISHELRTPLAGMLNLIELIGENPQKNCTGENIELILEAGQELKAMISTLLEALQNDSAGAVSRPKVPVTDKGSAEEGTIQALSHLGPLRVLIVEDNYINLLAFRQTLEQSGFSVQEAVNGEEALQCLRREPFDVVLMDVRMPVMDGLEATRRIRASRQKRLRETRVIAITGYSMLDDRQRIMEAGADGIITKPIDTEDLTRALKDLFPANR